MVIVKIFILLFSKINNHAADQLGISGAVPFDYAASGGELYPKRLKFSAVV